MKSRQLTRAFLLITGFWAVGACDTADSSTDGFTTNDSGTDSVCSPGDMRTCSGPDACEGAQLCSADGTWGSCDCADGTGGGAGTGGATGGAAGGGPSGSQWLTYYTNGSNETSQQIPFQLRIHSDVAVSASDLAVRYWLDLDGINTSVAIDSANIGAANVVAAVQADHIEFSFTSGSVAAGAYVEFQVRIYPTNWNAQFDQTNDWSWIGQTSGTSGWVDADHITVYHQGQLVYGLEPT
jgi:hypothetical protein